jgi:hypothetical protein
MRELQELLRMLDHSKWAITLAHNGRRSNLMQFRLLVQVQHQFDLRI